MNVRSSTSGTRFRYERTFSEPCRRSGSPAALPLNHTRPHDEYLHATKKTPGREGTRALRRSCRLLNATSSFPRARGFLRFVRGDPEEDPN